jgi:hypothetical protein
MTTWTWGYALQQFIMLGLWLVLLWTAYKEIRKCNANEKRYRRTGRISIFP